MPTYQTALSNEVEATTNLPAPVLDSVTANTSTIDVAWTATHTNGQTRVEYRDSGTSAWTTGATVAYDTESVTLTGVDNGAAIEVRVVATTPDADSPSGTLTDTTALPDEDQPLLLNGVENEVGVDRESAVTNAGDVRIQLRETGQSAWGASAVGYAEQTVAYDTLTTQFVGREDGEEYEVRARTQTDDVTGAWTEPTSIITKFPGSDNLVVTIVSSTASELAWDDNADNELGQLVVRERRLPDGSWGRERVIEDVGPDTETFVDDTVQPDREYRYRIRSYTDDTEADSNTDTGETPALDGVRDRRVPASGWRVEVDHPSGETLTPTVLTDAEWHPRLNAQPEIRVPVPRSSTWEDHDVEGSTIRAWKDGTRLPIDELQTTERDETRDVLVAVGGTQLENDVEGIEYPSADAHVAAEEVITDELGWAANVDDPQTDAREDVRLFQASDSQDFSDAIESDGDPFPPTSPLTVENSEVFAEATGWFREAEAADGSGVVNTTQGGEWSGGGSVRLSSGDRREVDFSPSYTIPEGEAKAVIVYGITTGEAPGLEFTRIDPDSSETVVESFGEGGINDTGGQFELASFEVTLNNDGPLTPGSYSLEVRVPVTSGGELYLDFLHVRDDRYPIDEDIEPVDDVVTGWQQRPASIDVVFDPVTSVEQVTSGRVDVTLSNGGAPNALALRNDQTALWDEGTGTTHTASFAEPTQLIQARVTLGREDSGSQSGQFGDQPHRLEFLDLFADLVNTPVLLDFVHRGTIEELLNRIADAGDFIWELRRADESANAEYRIEWTQPGQRLADSEPTLVSFSGRRSIDDSYQRVIVEGKTSRVEGETFTANSYGLNVGLNEGPIDTGSETVYDVGDRSGTYERGLDYNVGHSEGTITILEGGSMTPGEQYEIDYEWRFEGSYTQPAVDDPDTLRESFPDATSNRECEQIALAVVREVAAPLEEARIDITIDDPNRILVNSLSADNIPFNGPLEVKEIQNTSDYIQLTVGSRQRVNEIVQDIRQKVKTVARNV